MKRGPDAHRTAENVFGRTKHENGTRRPWYPDAVGTAKTIPGAQKMKTGPDGLGTAENESGQEKQENGTRRPRYRRKRVRERKTRKWDLMPSLPPKMNPSVQNIKTVPDGHGTAENDSRRAKNENGT
jgi:hypothetical protein